MKKTADPFRKITLTAIILSGAVSSAAFALSVFGLDVAPAATRPHQAVPARPPVPNR